MENLRNRAASMARLCVLVAVALALAGCSLSGRVYIAFFWSDSEVPDAFACSTPNIPASAAAIDRGEYYETVAGNWTLSYSYLSGESHTVSFELAAAAAALGQEHAYYHATLRKTAGPTVETYP